MSSEIDWAPKGPKETPALMEPGEADILPFLAVSNAMSQGKLTTRQKEVLTFIEERQQHSGFAPTLEETAEHFGFRSPNSVRQHLRLIEKKGLVFRVPGRSRALVIPKARGRTRDGLVRVPVLGHIAAGIPMLAAENVETFLELPTQLFHGSQLFALRVQGRSMEGAGILNGDLAVLDAASDVKDGTIGAVLIGEDATLKRVCKKDGKLLLRAANPAFEDIKISPAQMEHTRVLGSLVGVVRTV